VNQVAKGVNDSYDALGDLLESIERFLKHLDIYTKIPPTPSCHGRDNGQDNGGATFHPRTGDKRAQAGAIE